MIAEIPETSRRQRGSAVLLTLLIALWGLLGLNGVTVLTEDPGAFLLRQCGWLVLGMALLLAAARLPYRRITAAVGWITLTAWAALAGVLFWGTPHHGMRGWYEWGGVALQPAEFAKPAFCLLAARIAAGTRPEWQRGMLLCGGSAGYLLLILLEPDFGTASVYLAGLLLAFWLGNFRWYAPAGAAALALPAVIAAAWRHPYVLTRLAAFWQTGGDLGGAGWHLHQFELCFARGGWSGVKQGAAAWSSGFLPLAHNDSIFAATGEIAGGFGAALLLLLFALWIGRLLRLGSHAPTPERRLFIDLASGMIALQAMLHVYVNLGLLPPTGVTLPLVSYGGSSLIGTMLTVGLILSASRPDPTDDRTPENA